MDVATVEMPTVDVATDDPQPFSPSLPAHSVPVCVLG